jgi:hypothetical protein
VPLPTETARQNAVPVTANRQPVPAWPGAR